MIATLVSLVLAASSPVCAPDLITQLPMLCEGPVQVPYQAQLPVGPNAEVSITAKTRTGAKSLRLAGAWGCVEWRSRFGLVAMISRCSTNLGIAIFRVRDFAPHRVRLSVGGTPT